MQTDSVLITESLQALIDSLWADEMNDFQFTYEVHIQSQDSLESWIEVCKRNGWTNHRFYHMMVIKSTLLATV
jgi:hypothetical protein